MESTLLQFDPIYVPQKVVKGQALADFLATQPCCESGIIYEDILQRVLFFDGSNIGELRGAGIYILSPKGVPTKLAVIPKGPCTNNRVEYEALLIGLELLLELGPKKAKIYRDSQLVIYQMTEEFKYMASVSQDYMSVERKHKNCLDNSRKLLSYTSLEKKTT